MTEAIQPVLVECCNFRCCYGMENAIWKLLMDACELVLLAGVLLLLLLLWMLDITDSKKSTQRSKSISGSGVEIILGSARSRRGLGCGTDFVSLFFFLIIRKKLNKSIDLLMMQFNQLNIVFDRQCRMEFIVAASIGIQFDGQKVS